VEPWELGAREEIRELVARYAHCADGGRFDDLVALFAEDSSCASTPRVLCGRRSGLPGGTGDDLCVPPCARSGTT
jgi:hypothetical protein